jgi:hypothetical protein
MDLNIYIVLTVCIAIGVFLRQHYVFLRKILDGTLAKADYEPKKLIDSLIATIITTFTTALASEFILTDMYDFTKPVTYILAFLFGILGNDLYHQFREYYTTTH